MIWLWPRCKAKVRTASSSVQQQIERDLTRDNPKERSFLWKHRYRLNPRKWSNDAGLEIGEESGIIMTFRLTISISIAGVWTPVKSFAPRTEVVHIRGHFHLRYLFPKITNGLSENGLSTGPCCFLERE